MLVLVCHWPLSSSPPASTRLPVGLSSSVTVSTICDAHQMPPPVHRGLGSLPPMPE
jgi:hypothetical protein